MEKQEKNRGYMRCRVYGEGEIIDESNGRSAEMQIEDMSGDGALVNTKLQIEVGCPIRLAVAFGGPAVQRTMSFKGVVKRLTHASAAGNCYGINFTNMTDVQKAEIDEIMRLSCHSGVMPNYESCEDEACLFKNRSKD